MNLCYLPNQCPEYPKDLSTLLQALEENVPSHDKGMTGLEEPLGEAKLTASANGHSDHGSTNGVVNGDDNIDKDPLEEDLMEVPTFTAVRIPLKPNPGLVTSTIYFLSFLYLSKATSV